MSDHMLIAQAQSSEAYPGLKRTPATRGFCGRGKGVGDLRSGKRHVRCLYEVSLCETRLSMIWVLLTTTTMTGSSGELVGNVSKQGQRHGGMTAYVTYARTSSRNSGWAGSSRGH